MNTNVRDELVALADSFGRQKVAAREDCEDAFADAMQIAEADTRDFAARLPSLDVDELAQFIRAVDGNHSMGAGALAERIVERFSARLSGERAFPSSASVPSFAEAVAVVCSKCGDYMLTDGVLCPKCGPVAAPPSPLADPRVREWTDAQCVQFMATALRHVEYKRGTNGPTCDDIRLGVSAALRALSGENGGQS